MSDNTQIYFRINGKEAYDEWGIYMAQGSLAELLTPAPNKAYIQSECADENGKRVLADIARTADREVRLTLYLCAGNLAEFLDRYASFCKELEGGKIDIETHYIPNKVFRCVYLSCSQFEQWDGQLAKYTLRLSEPNPQNRDR